MTLEVLLQLAKIIAQNSAYLGCLSWLAWRIERSRGTDAFNLVVIYSLGAWLLSVFVNGFSLDPFLSICILSSFAFALDVHWPALSLQSDNAKSLIQIIVLASVALIVFDWVTSHTPISLSVGGGLRSFALLCAFVAWVLIFFTSRSKAGMVLRLGTRNHWAVEYWSHPLPTVFYHIKIACLLCWVSVLTIPMTTTGLLSSTILKDIAIGILIARVAATRGALIVLAMSVTLSILRTAVGFAFPSNVGPPLVELTVFISMLFWLRYRSNRTTWDELNAR